MNIVITGGAGFIGCNSADHFLNQGHELTIYDNMSRPGSQANLNWLQERHGDSWNFVQGDVRDYDGLASAVYGADVVLHLASQVAVTTSVTDPREDFENNALGTFNTLEAVRHNCPQAAVLYASTNKVYGAMEGVRIEEEPTRYRFADFVDGIPENFPLDFHSPYGCSKGAGDQYVIDYARIYGLKSVALRQSCIYGPRQFGIEDQGWVAHFIIAGSLDRPITIYGNGKQVRDLLHISDLIRAYDRVISQIDEVKGQAINLAGGPQNTLSIWSEFGPWLESKLGHPMEIARAETRPGDQLVFVANIERAKRQLGWQPEISVQDGIDDLFQWVGHHLELFP
jgi:CDP-paratose 2-epimerase